MAKETDDVLFHQRALVLGCNDLEAALLAQIATKRGWRFLDSSHEFDRVALDYLVALSAGEAWPRDLEVELERLNRTT